MDILTLGTLPEVTISRELSFTTVAGRKIYFVPLGEHFFDAPSETEILYGGLLHRIGDGFYTHIHRSMSPWMNVTDTMIGIALTTPPPAGVTLILRWKQRIILLAPPSALLVHCSHYITGWKPDYTLVGWKQNDPTVAPNAIQISLPPPGYVVEWWRLTRQKGGDHGGYGSGYRAGRQYLPVYRGPAIFTDNESLFLKTQFDQSSQCAPWKHYKVCYYNPITGARGALSSEVIISPGNIPDQHNSKGPVRYSLWINR